MKTWRITGSVVGGKYLGEVEAETKEQAIEKGWKLANVTFCHHCSGECENAVIDEIDAECDEEEAKEEQP